MNNFTRFKLVESMKGLISNVGQQLIEVRENYDMGLITFNEYMIQVSDIYGYYSIRVSDYLKATMEVEQVSLEFLKGYLAHESIGC